MVTAENSRTFHRGALANELQEVGRNWGWIVLAGAALTFLGCVAIGSSITTTVVTMVFIGAAMIAAAIVHAVEVFAVRGWNLRLQQALLAVLYFVIGALVTGQPAAAAASLTLLAAAFLMVGGLFRIASALLGDIPHRGWIVANGILTTLLGILLFNQWPASGLWLIGLYVGIDLAFSGATLIGIGLSARRLAKRLNQDRRLDVPGGATVPV